MKRIPFDIDLAKKIQAGEKRGNIVTRQDGNYGKRFAKILWDGIYERCSEKFILVILRDNSDRDDVMYYLYDDSENWSAGNEPLFNGRHDPRDEEDSPSDLCIEVPEEEYQFKAFEKVVVRGNGVSVPWKTDFFSHIDKDNLDVHYVCVGGWWSYCLPYTEHTAQLIGTTDKWDGYPDGIL